MRLKKLWKAALSAVTALALAATPLASNVTVAEESPYTPILDRNGDPVDLGGIEIVIRDWWTDPSLNYIANPRDDYEKAKKELAEWAMKTYNFKVTFDGGEGLRENPEYVEGESGEDVPKYIKDWDYIPVEYVEYVADYDKEADADEYYMFTLYDHPTVAEAVTSGKMYDLATLDYIDFSDPIFQGNKVHEQYSIKNHIYAMNTGICEPRTGVFFNKAVLKAAGIDPDTIYEAQKNGTWTWEMFDSLIAKVTDIDPDDRLSSDNVYGLVADQGSLAEALITSNGSSLVALEDGEFVNKLSDPKTVAALKYANKLIKEENGFYTQDIFVERYMAADGVFDEIKDEDIPADVKAAGPEAIDEFCRHFTEDRIGKWEEEHQEFMESTWEYYKEAFSYGNVGFIIGDHWMGTMPYAEDMGWGDFDLGFVMMPAGPSGELMNLWKNNALVIPGCYDKEKAQKIAFAYYVINQEPKGFEGYNHYITYSELGKFDKRAIEETIPAMCHPNYGTVTYSSMVPKLEIGPQFLWDYNGQDDPYNPDAIGLDNFIKKVSAEWDKYVDDANSGVTAGIKGAPNYIKDKNLSWNDVAGKKYWYEGGYKQGTVDDPKSFEFEGTIRGREVADPATNQWYWLDANADGAMADTKEVFMPYIYQDEADYLDNDDQIKAVAQLSNLVDNENEDFAGKPVADLSEQVYKAIKAHGTMEGGKWVRYTNSGDMVKGWYKVEGKDAEVYTEQAGNVYYYDYQTGLMAKGDVTINGVEYHFDEVTGVLDKGEMPNE